MKAFIILSASLCLLTVSAEPPRFRNARFRPKFQRQELAPTTDSSDNEPTTGPPDQGPYPPAGYQPAGPAFTLPSKQQAPPNSYGAPLNTYGPPDSAYGPPVAAQLAPVKPPAENLEILDVQKSLGSYYVFLPTGKLQKIEISEADDTRNAASSSKIQVNGEDNAAIFAIPRFIRL